MCKWRNTAEVLPFMEDLRKVTVPVLEFWLKKTEASRTAFPFLAYGNGEPVAYIDVRNCDYAHSCCEDGIFLFDSRRFGTGLGSRIWLCREHVLRALDICTVMSTIRPENRRSIRFFEKMGGKPVEVGAGFLVLRQEQGARMAALRRVAARLDLLEEYEKSFCGTRQTGRTQ